MNHTGLAGDGRGSGKLIVLTGASHTGKSSVARELVRLGLPPIALLGVDQTITHTLVQPIGDPWLEIPLAYRLNRAELEPLLEEGWMVVLETTFTFVDGDGNSELHEGELNRTIAVARGRGAPYLVVHLEIPEEVALHRAASSNRVSPEIVRQTVRLHDAWTPPDGTLRIEYTAATAEQIARRILAIGEERLVI